MSRPWFLFIAYTEDTDNSFGKMSKALRIASTEVRNTGVRQTNSSYLLGQGQTF